jgi:PKHD-type hydroxylase
VRDPAQREALFDLETSLREVFGREGKSDLFDRLAKTRSNLVRMWADG